MGLYGDGQCLWLFPTSLCWYHGPTNSYSTVLQWNLGNKTTIRAMKSGLIFEVVLIIHVYTDLVLNQSGLISKVVVL